jgi:TatD DNase family protein
MYDSHSHLTHEPLLNIYKEAVDNFESIGGKGIVNVGYDLESNYKVLEIFDSLKSITKLTIFNAIGLHPELFNPITDFQKVYLSYKEQKRLLNHFEKLLHINVEKISVIGETGLDYHLLFEKEKQLKSDQIELSIELQKFSFRRHVEFSRELSKPITIHTRDVPGQTRAIEDAIQIISECGKCKGTGSFHCYTGNPEYIKEIVDIGFYIGFNGIITYPKANNVRKLLETTPLENILFETDAPLLPPQNVRSNKKSPIRFGQPSNILEIIKTASEIKGITTEKMIQISNDNFNRFITNEC